MGRFPTSGSRWRGVETEPLMATAPLLDPTDEKGAETLRDDYAAAAGKPSTEVDRADSSFSPPLRRADLLLYLP
jgi:hypothetical protein